MTPREHGERKAEAWQHPLSEDDCLLHEVLDKMFDFKLSPEDVPLVIKLVENPRHRTSKIFTGAVDLFTHDCIHILLGRGLRLKDEAFVIGYTMGSTKKMRRWRRNLYMFFAKYLFPKGYNFGEEERFIFNMGIMAGSQCPVDLSMIDFKNYKSYKISGLRKELNIDRDLLKNCYAVEKKCFPESEESQRLL